MLTSIHFKILIYIPLTFVLPIRPHLMFLKHFNLCITFTQTLFSLANLKFTPSNTLLATALISFRLNHFSWLTYISPLLGSAWIYCYLLKSWYWNFFHIYIMHVHVVESKWAKRLYFKILNCWIKNWGSYPDILLLSFMIYL